MAYTVQLIMTLVQKKFWRGLRAPLTPPGSGPDIDMHLNTSYGYTVVIIDLIMVDF